MLRALPHLLQAHAIPRVHVVFGMRRRPRNRICRSSNTARFCGFPAASPAPRIMGPVTPRSSMSSSEMKPTPLVRRVQMGFESSRFFVLVHLARERADELAHRFLPAARRLQRQPADADVAGHHALAREHFEDAQNVFALAEAVKEHAHRADIERVRSQPHQMAVEPRKFRHHDAQSTARAAEFRSAAASRPPARRPGCSKDSPDNRRDRSASPPAASSSARTAFSMPVCRKPMSGAALRMVSPSSSSTMRSTPWVDGCCGPMFSVIAAAPTGLAGISCRRRRWLLRDLRKDFFMTLFVRVAVLVAVTG